MSALEESVRDNCTRALWRLPRVIDVTGLGRSSIYVRMKEGTFPQAISIDGGRMVAWSSIEVEAWVDYQIAGSRNASKQSG